MNTTQRRDELLGVMGERYESLPYETKSDIAFYRTEVPMWLKIERSIKKQITEKNDEKRLHVQMLPSDPVVKFLGEMRDRVDTVLTKYNEEYLVDVDFDNGQSDSYKRETKKDFIAYLEGFIAERKLDTLAGFGSINDNNNYLASSEFGSMEELYNFLKELSKKSDEEIAEFILDTLPSYAWDIPYISLKGE